MMHSIGHKNHKLLKIQDGGRLSAQEWKNCNIWVTV